MDKKFVILIVVAVIGFGGLFGGYFLTKDKEGATTLAEQEIRVQVISGEGKSFTGKVLEMGTKDIINYKDEIVFNFEEDIPEGVEKDNIVILEIPKSPIMTNSIPPQMPQTKIVDILSAKK